MCVYIYKYAYIECNEPWQRGMNRIPRQEDWNLFSTIENLHGIINWKNTLALGQTKEQCCMHTSIYFRGFYNDHEAKTAALNT